ncbi:hypothetical protein L7F22_042817 [Adiantum nelumboides]|nr:hypothetical protein [Adiantum nelumboides]
MQKYPFEEVLAKENKKSSKIVANGKKQVELPVMEDFEEEQLKEAARMIDEQSGFLRLAMGHEDASIDDYAEAREATSKDLVYFPSRQAYNSASVASNPERLAALQYEFEIIKKHMQMETKKAVRSEQKLRVLTQGNWRKLLQEHDAEVAQVAAAHTAAEARGLYLCSRRGGGCHTRSSRAGGSYLLSRRGGGCHRRRLLHPAATEQEAAIPTAEEAKAAEQVAATCIAS